MSQSLTIQAQTTIDIEPELQQRLQATLSMYTGLCDQIRLLQDVADDEKAKLQAMLEEAGLDKAAIDGYNVAIVRGTTSSLDKKKLVAQGVTEAMIAMATTIKPKRPYVTVRKAGEKAESGEE